MGRLHNKDIFDIFNLFELEFYSIRNLAKKDEMRIRKKLNNILKPALRAPIIKTDDILKLAESKLHDVLALFRDKEEFLHKLEELLDERLLLPEEKAFLKLNGLDSKTIRKKLDNIGFSRSSSLRLALTRILRDSSDAKELLASIKRESQKIVHPEEIAVLLKLKEKQELAFMADIINLLVEKIDRNIGK